MRPSRLRVRGLASFAEEIEIDFENLGLFAITGPTGAGKTSLLTAMAAALYGRAPEVADDLRQLITTGGQEARLPIRREIHVTRPERPAESGADRFLAEMLHVERGLALSLSRHHSRVERAQNHHGAQSLFDFVTGEGACPWPDGIPLRVQDPDDRECEVTDVLGRFPHIGTSHSTGFRDHYFAEVGMSARAKFRFGHMQRQGNTISHERLPRYRNPLIA